MAEQAQLREEFVARLQSCMNVRGWHLTVDESAGFAEPFDSLEELERAGADRDQCLEEQGIDPTAASGPSTEAALREMYRYDVDTHECLVARGLRLERTPPSVDQYIEDGLASQSGESVADPWWPYGDPAVLALLETDVAELRVTCPERWSFAGIG
jgi:hypothetical protein